MKFSYLVGPPAIVASSLGIALATDGRSVLASSFATADWHILRDLTCQGPYDFSKIQSMVSRGEVLEKTPLLYASEWRAAGDVDELKALFDTMIVFPQPPPPPPPFPLPFVELKPDPADLKGLLLGSWEFANDPVVCGGHVVEKITFKAGDVVKGSFSVQPPGKNDRGATAYRVDFQGSYSVSDGSRSNFQVGLFIHESTSRTISTVLTWSAISSDVLVDPAGATGRRID